MTDHRDIFDPKLDALLDRALAPEPAPPGLADRIVAATRHDVAKLGQPALASGGGASGETSGVIARIGVQRLRRIAAVLIMGMEMGIWATIIGITRDASALVDIRHDLSRLDRISLASAAPAAPVDDEIRLLADEINTRRNGGDWDSQEAALDLALAGAHLPFIDESVDVNQTLTF